MKKRKRVILGIIISIFLAITAIVISLSSTNAIFTHKDTNTRRNNYNTGILSITAVSKSDTISLDNALPISDEEGIEQEPYIFTVKNNGNVDYKFDIQLLSTTANTFDPQYIKIKVDNDEVTTLSALTDSKIKTNLVLAAQETVDISIRIWLASNTPNTQIGKTFTSQLVINGVAVSPTSNYEASAAAYITNLYNNATKTEVENNSITYNYATSVSLMNDRLGGTTIDLNAGNIRYYGASPNNYVWLGETYKTSCTADVCGTAKAAGTKKLYRIIGVFDNMLKVITEDLVGYYSWDTSVSTVNSGNGINEWTQADLMKLLNPGYENETINNSLYWNGETAVCYAGAKNFQKNCSFTNAGPSDNVKNKIASVTWYLGALDSNEIFSDTAYAKERGTTHIANPADGIARQDKWEGKIGLIYPSDYGYAADLGSCEDVVLKSYNNNQCTSNNWLFNQKPYWCITASSDNATETNIVVYEGSFGSTYSSNNIAVRPTFYLNSDVSIASGTGTSADPYILR